MKYLLIEQKNITDNIKAQLKGRAKQFNGKFQEDSEETLRFIELKSNPEVFYIILKYKDIDKPTSVDIKYSELSTENEGKIFSEEEVLEFLQENVLQSDLKDHKLI